MHPADAFLLTEGEDLVWETFHENSKTSRVEPHVYFGRHPSDATVVAMMRGLRDVKPYTDLPRLALPADSPCTAALDDTLLGRESARGFGPEPLTQADLGAVLRRAYGVTRDNADTAYPRPFRAVPSGGALYPLELYVWARAVDGIDPGLYHYDPYTHELSVLGQPHTGPSGGPGRGTAGGGLAAAFVQRELVEQAAAVLLVSAVFFRSVFKYGERGYRFVLIEAGHLAQNAVLAAHGRDLAAVPVGGYFDREVDRALGLDGLHESVVYGLLLGGGERP